MMGGVERSLALGYAARHPTALLTEACFFADLVASQALVPACCFHGYGL